MENIDKMKRRRTENTGASTVVDNKKVKLEPAQLTKVDNVYQKHQVQGDIEGPESSLVDSNAVNINYDENVLGPPYYCDLCHQYFCSALTLTQHENLQHKVKVCSCEICDKPIPTGSYSEGENDLNTVFNLNIHTKAFRLSVQKNLNAEIVNDSSLHRNVNRKIPVIDLKGKNKNDLIVEKKLNDINFKRIVPGVRTYSSPKNKKLVNINEQSINTDNSMINDEEAVVDSGAGSGREIAEAVNKEEELFAKDPSSTAPDSNSLIDRLHYQCEFCEVTYIRWDYMMSHIARVHISAKPFSCNICLKQFAKKTCLLDHVQVHKPYACNVCARAFSSKVTLLRHMQHYCINRSKQDTIYACDRCKKEYSSKVSLYNHRRYSCYDKTGEMAFACSYCSYKCPKQYHLNRHISIRHSLVYTCDVCNRDFTNKSHMQRHLLVHNGIKQFSCKICNKLFRRKERMAEHALRHSNLKPFPCKECGKGFFRNEYVVRHNKLYCNEEMFAKKPYMCDVCKRRFENKSLLTKHIVKNHLLVFACDSCEKKFGDKYKLEAHLRRHTKNRPTYSLAKKRVEKK